MKILAVLSVVSVLLVSSMSSVRAQTIHNADFDIYITTPEGREYPLLLNGDGEPSMPPGWSIRRVPKVQAVPEPSILVGILATGFVFFARRKRFA